MQSTRSRIVYVAGRSGGHIIPAITLANQYKSEHEPAEILFVATKGSLDRTLLAAEKTIDQVFYLGVDNVPSRVYRYPIFLGQMVAAWAKSLFLLLKKRPQKVVLLGGYISIPVCLAAWLLRIPRELYELNAVPGKATRFLAPFATRILLCFVQSKCFFAAKKSVVVPYPVRFASALRDSSAEEARVTLGLAPCNKTILVLGGSQGSIFINNAVKASILAVSAQQSLQVIHQTGPYDVASWQQWYRERGVQAMVFAYHNDLSNHYLAADLVIGRAGAGTIFEILFFQKKAIMIPLETSDNDHQLHNALATQQSYSSLITIVRQQDIEKNKQLLGLSINSLL